MSTINERLRVAMAHLVREPEVTVSIVTPHQVRPLKPHLQRYVDEYALTHGQLWCCSHAGFCARGASPREAYNRLMDHFHDLRGWSRHDPQQGRVRR